MMKSFHERNSQCSERNEEDVIGIGVKQFVTTKWLTYNLAYKNN
jgi:hypothetical protein